MNTNLTHERRRLRFSSLLDLEAELKRIEQSHKSGTLRHTGKWTPGQILGHLAAWIRFGWEGFPPSVRAPWPVRMLLQMRKKKFLASELPVGFKLPRVEGGTVATDVLPFEEGLSRLRAALEPLKRGEAPPVPSPAFGRLNNAECIQLHLRHAELHLGFLQY